MCMPFDKWLKKTYNIRIVDLFELSDEEIKKYEDEWRKTKNERT